MIFSPLLGEKNVTSAVGDKSSCVDTEGPEGGGEWEDGGLPCKEVKGEGFPVHVHLPSHEIFLRHKSEKGRAEHNPTSPLTPFR